MAHILARRNRAVWDRPATDTRLLLRPRPIPVSLRSPVDPLRMSIKTSAPSRPPSPQRHLAADACELLPQMIALGYPGHRASGEAADARAPSPRMITHGSYPQRTCPTTVDARVLSRMNSRSALLGVEADACGNAPRMISRFTLLGVKADACGNAPRMISQAPALDAAARAAEGALAPFILTLSPSLSLCPSSFRRGDRPIALGWSIPARPQLAESGTSAIAMPLRRIEGSQERNVCAVSGPPTHRKEPA